ncbi:hypothetical protein AB0A71_41700 [Kitasatospora aureofaciens]|uniref:hypothetical protein n=1 Tax=Kitasatospora aureofaciens TaxID=1894 RepID=UPI0033F56BDF
MTALVRASPTGASPLLDDLAMLIAANERGHVVKRPSKPAIGTMPANLRRGNAQLR